MWQFVMLQNTMDNKSFAMFATFLGICWALITFDFFSVLGEIYTDNGWKI